VIRHDHKVPNFTLIAFPSIKLRNQAEITAWNADYRLIPIKRSDLRPGEELNVIGTRFDDHTFFKHALDLGGWTFQLDTSTPDAQRKIGSLNLTQEMTDKLVELLERVETARKSLGIPKEKVVDAREIYH
jgi:hypothetical protein